MESRDERGDVGSILVNILLEGRDGVGNGLNMRTGLKDGVSHLLQGRL